MKDYKQNRRVITGGCGKPPSEGDSNDNWGALTDKRKQYIKRLEKLLGMKKIFRI